jgi:hypothetical protein
LIIEVVPFPLKCTTSRWDLDFDLYKIYLVRLMSVGVVYKLPLTSILKQFETLRCTRTIAVRRTWGWNETLVTSLGVQTHKLSPLASNGGTTVSVHFKVTQCLWIEVKGGLYTTFALLNTTRHHFIKDKNVRAHSTTQSRQYLKTNQFSDSWNNVFFVDWWNNVWRVLIHYFTSQQKKLTGIRLMD